MNRPIMFALVVAVAGVVAACSSSPSGTALCDEKSKCSADPARTADDVAACKKQISEGACKSEFEAVAKCALDNQKCTSSNTTDVQAVLTACTTQNSAYSTCLTASLDAGGD